MTGPLISVDELRDRLAEVTLLDVRYRLGGPPGPGEFAAGHVPGAAYVDLDTALAAPPGDPVDDRGRHPLPGPDEFSAAMRAAGVGDRPVVVYDDWAGRGAARAWWLLTDAGHGDVRVLDGGWPAWLASGGATETGPTEPQPGDFVGRPGHRPRVSADDLADAAVVIDARAPERYRGEVEPVDPVAGHIPGAVNIPTDANLTANGTFRSADELADVYAAVGSAPVVYCGSGVTACHDLLALAVAGIDGVLYPPSWSGYVSDSTRPVAGSPVDAAE